MCVPGLASVAGGTVCKLLEIKHWVFHWGNFPRLEFFCEIHVLHGFWRSASGVARSARVLQANSVCCKCSSWAIPWRARHDAIRDAVGWIWLKSAWGVPHRTVCFRHFQSFQDLPKKVAMREAICIHIGQAPFVCSIKVSIGEKLWIWPILVIHIS